MQREPKVNGMRLSELERNAALLAKTAPPDVQEAIATVMDEAAKAFSNSQADIAPTTS
ncbi:hypothetical protein [Bradyrhizobium sp. USDA 4486]